MADITMSIDDTLELDAIIEKWSNPDSVITDNDNQFNLSGFQTNTGVLDPQNTGEHTITVNGQELTVKVTGSETIIEDFEDGDVSEWNIAGDSSVGGIQNVNISYNGDKSGEVFVNGQGSDVIPYYNDRVLSADSSSKTLKANVQWDERATNLMFGFAEKGNESTCVGFGSGYKDGNDWAITEFGSFTNLDTLNKNPLDTNTWYEITVKIKTDNTVIGTIYNLSNGERESERVKLTGTQSEITDLSELYPAVIGVAYSSGSNAEMVIDNIRE